ncbi:hypothetical protein ACIPV2_01270 [Microbacterium sp. NPDC089987]|uniref:hypothetical protein n=1 Tax=Microbacterium sp. NPDC089987 TaxID=3364202 RepID=UPI0037F75236
MPTQDELKVTVGRLLLLEDALWIGDILASARRHNGPAQAMVPLLLSGHAARVVYEGRELLTSPNKNVALPDFVDLLRPELHSSIPPARHATKMLDNAVKKGQPVNEYELDIHEAWMSQRTELMSKVRRGFSWLQPDLGFYTLGGAVVGATIPLHLRFRLDEVPVENRPAHFRKLGLDLYTSLKVFSYLSGKNDAITPSLDLTAMDSIRDNDRSVNRYLKRGYDGVRSIDQRLLLLLIESEVNTAATLIPLVTGPHVTAAFRARLISLWHALSSVRKILAADPARTSPAATRVREVADSVDARRLSAKGMDLVRNRSMHYEIRGKTQFAFSNGPMFGIIESVTGETFGRLDTVVRDVSQDMSAALREWRNSRWAPSGIRAHVGPASRLSRKRVLARPPLP